MNSPLNLTATVLRYAGVTVWEPESQVNWRCEGSCRSILSACSRYIACGSPCKCDGVRCTISGLNMKSNITHIGWLINVGGYITCVIARWGSNLAPGPILPFMCLAMLNVVVPTGKLLALETAELDAAMFMPISFMLSGAFWSCFGPALHQN